MNTNRYIGLFVSWADPHDKHNSTGTLCAFDLDTRDHVFCGEFLLKNSNATETIFRSLMSWADNGTAGNHPQLWFFVQDQPEILKVFAEADLEDLVQRWIDFNSFHEQVSQRSTLSPLRNLPKRRGQSLAHWRYENTMNIRKIFQETIKTSFDYGGPQVFLGDASVSARAQSLQRT